MEYITLDTGGPKLQLLVGQQTPPPCTRYADCNARLTVICNYAQRNGLDYLEGVA